MKATHLFLTLFTLIFFSCLKKKTEDTLPAVTMEGKNAFGCYVDGQLFNAALTFNGTVQPVFACYFTVPTYKYKAGFFSIEGVDARNTLDVAGTILINKLNVFHTGEYALADMTMGRSCGANYACDEIGYRNFRSGQFFSATAGKLTISKLDTVNKIMSGTFYFTAKDRSGNSATITDGRFDARYTN